MLLVIYKRYPTLFINYLLPEKRHPTDTIIEREIKSRITGVNFHTKAIIQAFEGPAQANGREATSACTIDP
jgi:hypothetical protein